MTASKPLALDAYEALADSYGSLVDTKPHNAYYDRPAVLELAPDLKNKKVLDVGCGPGAYTEAFLKRGAKVAACDVSPRMLALAKERIGGAAEFHLVNIEQPLVMFSDAGFDVVAAPLVLDYVRDWTAVFCEFHRVLKPGGVFIMSAGHPSFDAEYFETSDYFSVQSVECEWTGFGKPVRMPSYRRSLAAFINPFMAAGFRLDKLVEPQPTEDFRRADPKRCERLMRRPAFLCARASKHE